MEALLIVNSKLKESLKDMDAILAFIFSDINFQKWLLDIIRYKQMFEEGVGEENIIIGNYSPATEALNPNKQAYSHFTLRDTGAFYESMKVYVNATNIVIDADGNKTDPITGEVINIFELYGQEQNLLGLTEPHWDELLEKLKPLIIEQLWKHIAA